MIRRFIKSNCSKQPIVKITTALSTLLGNDSSSRTTCGMSETLSYKCGMINDRKTCAQAFASKSHEFATNTNFVSTNKSLCSWSMAPVNWPRANIPTSLSMAIEHMAGATCMAAFSDITCKVSRIASMEMPFSFSFSASNPARLPSSNASTVKLSYFGKPITTMFTPFLCAVTISPMHHGRVYTELVPNTTKFSVSMATKFNNWSKESRLSESKKISREIRSKATISIFNHLANAPASSLWWQRKNM
mmetsp:Transcript_45094/g.130213  ORF Transcript_45094/g.130213 Transcript_45094/m.130213 type:complete len:247 (-) Transcript_45094:421-1161(-)